MATRKFPSPEMRLFTTREFSQIFSIPLSVASRRLTSLEKSGIVDRVAKGLWWQRSHGSVSRYSLVPKLLAKEQGYISFLTALNYHDVIDQIPSAIMVATTGYPRKLKTKVAHYEFIKLAPKMMTEGYDWVDTKDPYLMASPEKALLDTFYISTRKERDSAGFQKLTGIKSVKENL